MNLRRQSNKVFHCDSCNNSFYNKDSISIKVFDYKSTLCLSCASTLLDKLSKRGESIS